MLGLGLGLGSWYCWCYGKLGNGPKPIWSQLNNSRTECHCCETEGVINHTTCCASIFFIQLCSALLPLITLHGLAVSAITQVPNNNERMEEDESDTFISPG